MIDFRVQRNWSMGPDAFDIWILEWHQRGFGKIAKPVQLVFEDHPAGHLLPAPTLSVDGIFGRELIAAARKSFAGQEWLGKEETDLNSKIEKAMQSHIESLKFVIEKTVGKP